MVACWYAVGEVSDGRPVARSSSYSARLGLEWHGLRAGVPALACIPGLLSPPATQHSTHTRTVRGGWAEQQRRSLRAMTPYVFPSALSDVSCRCLDWLQYPNGQSCQTTVCMLRPARQPGTNELGTQGGDEGTISEVAQRQQGWFHDSSAHCELETQWRNTR